MNRHVKWLWQEYQAFGASVAIPALLCKVYKYGVHKDALAWRLNTWKHRSVIKCLERKYGDVISRYVDRQGSRGAGESACKDYIWTLWWQGEESAPETIRMCFQSMRNFAGGHPVVVISEDNYADYIHLPDYFLEKVQCGQISFTHFSDIIRMYLLYHYGGMWLDATMYLTAPVPEEIFSFDYYTGKLEPYRMLCVSEGRWNGAFVAGKPGNVFFDFMIHFFYEYWREEVQEIDYFQIDYMTELACRCIPACQAQLAMVPFNNRNIFQLTPYLNCPFDEGVYRELLQGTSFHKLQRRNEYVRWTTDGERTFYGYLYDLVYEGVQ